MKSRVLISAMMTFLLLLFYAEEAEGQNNVGVAYSVEAKDYIAPLNDLVQFLSTRGNEMQEFYSNWAAAGASAIRNIEVATDTAQATEQEVCAKVQTGYKQYGDDVINMLIRLDMDRSKAQALVNDLIAEQEKVAGMLRDMEVTDAKTMADLFKSMQKAISPTTNYPAESANTTVIEFRRKPEVYTLPGYIEPLNEMIMWYWNVEQAVAETITYWNTKVEARMLEDIALQELQTELKEELAQYTDTKAYKSEISFLKKRINQVEKERKAVAKAMSNDSKELINDMKAFHIELTAAYKERLNHVLIEMNYLANRIN